MCQRGSSAVNCRYLHSVHTHTCTPAGKLDHHGCPKFVHSGQDVREREVHDVMHDQVGGRQLA